MKISVPPCLLFAALMTAPLSAQQPPTIAEKSADPVTPEEFDARTKEVAAQQAILEANEKRTESLRKQVTALDESVEKEIKNLVEMLTRIEDSTDSRNQVRQLKKETITVLKQSIDRYAMKRRSLDERARQGDQTVSEDIGELNNRIISRVDQIVDLTKSFPGYQEVDKYEPDGATYWNGYTVENSRITEEFKQNRRNATASTQETTKVLDELRKSRDEFQQQRGLLTLELADPQLGEDRRKANEQRLGEIDAMRDHFSRQIYELLSPEQNQATEKIGPGEARLIEDQIDRSRRELRQRISEMFRVYYEYDKARLADSKMSENLAAKQQWLEENAPAPAETNPR